MSRKPTNNKALLAIAIMGAFFGPAAMATAINEAPPTGAILDLAGGETGTAAQTINHNSAAPTTETVSFTAAVANTDITLALRDDPAFLEVSNVSLVNTTTGSTTNLLTNGDFSGGTYTSNGNTGAPNGWDYANIYGATFGGVVQSSCGAFANCWSDGAVQAYDAIAQTVGTTIGDTYALSFQYWETGGQGTFSDVSTNGDTTGTGGNGINILAYAQQGLPAPATVPDPSTLALLGLGLAGLAVRRKGRVA